jgi:hypothetical protein
MWLCRNVHHWYQLATMDPAVHCRYLRKDTKGRAVYYCGCSSITVDIWANHTHILLGCDDVMQRFKKLVQFLVDSTPCQFLCCIRGRWPHAFFHKNRAYISWSKHHVISLLLHCQCYMQSVPNTCINRAQPSTCTIDICIQHLLDHTCTMYYMYMHHV